MYYKQFATTWLLLSPVKGDLLHKYGTESTLERGGRYFPASNKSADVLQALLKWVNELKAEIRCGHRVEKLLVENNAMQGIQANEQKFMTRHVILATSGNSYPATGSNGEGYELARRVRYSIILLPPSSSSQQNPEFSTDRRKYLLTGHLHQTEW